MKKTSVDLAAMKGRIAIATSAPARSHHLAATVVVVLTCLLGLVTIPFDAVALPEIQSFLPVFGSISFFADLMTAALLFSQAKAAQDRATAYLAVAYLVSVLTIIPYLLAIPGALVPDPVIGGSASGVWLWCIWHAGFALCVCRYALRAGREEARGVKVVTYVASTAMFMLLLGLLVTMGLPYLPTILIGNSYALLNISGVGPFVLVCNVAALMLVAMRLRGRNILSVWLAVAMVTANLDVLLTLLGGARFTLGWYVARCLSMATGIIVLIALLSELTRLFNRTVQANRQLEILTLTDSLTQIPNRRAFDQSLVVEWRRSCREQDAISLLIVDIDFFKEFNDIYGHPQGDECLRRVSAVIQLEARRGGNLAARVGGEEFAVLLPGVEEAGAQKVGDLVQAAVAALALDHSGSLTGHVTVSIGITTMRPEITSRHSATLMEAADQALYHAKQTGRNRSCVASAAAAAYPFSGSRLGPDVRA
jgi:diguanylate cyclase (GGDEF)-like protein